MSGPDMTTGARSECDGRGVGSPLARYRPRRLQLLTASRLKAYRRCARLHHLRYVLGYRAVEDVAALRFGSLIHFGLQRWWEAQLPAADRARIVAAVRTGFVELEPSSTADQKHLTAALEHGEPFEAAQAATALATAPLDGREPYEGAQFDRVKAEVMLAGYHHRWIEADLAAISVEVEFRAPLRNPSTRTMSRAFALAGKIDVLVAERRTGRVLVVEHKTASESFEDGSVYRARLKLNNQISMYIRGAERLGFTPAACLYDVLGKAAIRPFKATPPEQRKYTRDKRDKNGNLIEPARLYAQQREADETPEEYGARLREHIAERPDEYFARFEVVRLDDEMVEHDADIWETARAMRESEVAGHTPKNDDGCFSFGRPCEFLPVCAREASLEDGSRYVRSDNVHPELSGH